VAVALLVLFPISHRARARDFVFLCDVKSSVPIDYYARRARAPAGTFAALPLAFEQNQGQTDPQVKYMRGPTATRSF